MSTLPKLARLLLADDRPALFGQTASLLADGSEIVGTVGNGLELLDAAAQLDPDVRGSENTRCSRESRPRRFTTVPTRVLRRGP